MPAWALMIREAAGHAGRPSTPECADWGNSSVKQVETIGMGKEHAAMSGFEEAAYVLNACFDYWLTKYRH